MLKSYLVKIETQVDQASKNKAMAEIDSTKGKLSNLFKMVSSMSIKAGATILSSVISVNKYLVNTVKEISDLDVTAERFARKLWTSEKNARALQSALDAVGSDFSDINNMTNEEFQRMNSLRKFGLGLEAPAEAQQTLKLFRDFVYLVNKFQVLIKYAGQWFVYYFGKYAGNDLIKLRDRLRNLLDLLAQKMPMIMDKVAKFFYIFYRLASTLFWVLEKIPLKVYAAGAALLGILKIVKTGIGPVQLFIVALTALLLLLEDYLTWKQGGKSLLGNQWQAITNSLNDPDSFLSGMVRNAQTFLGVMQSIIMALSSGFNKLVDWAEEFGLMEKSATLIKVAFETINKVISGGFGLIGDFFEFILKAGKWLVNPTGENWDNLKSFFSETGQDWSDFWNKEAGDITNPYGSRGGGFNKTANQTNNINVTYGGNEDPYNVGREIGRGIISARERDSMFR